LAIGHGGSNFISVYKRSGDAFTRLARPATVPSSTVSGLAWSPDDTYLAVADAGVSSIRIYKRSGDTLTLTDTESVGSNPQGCGWSPDGTYLSVTFQTSPRWKTFTISGDVLTDVGAMPALPGTGADIDWHPSGDYVAVQHFVSPYLSVFSRSGTTFTKISDPATLPVSGPGNAYGGSLRWAPDGLQLSMGQSSSPYICTYSFDSGTDTLTRLSNPATLPTGSGGGVTYFHNPPPSTTDVVGSAAGTSTASASHESTGPMSSVGSSAGVADAAAVGEATTGPTANLTLPLMTISAQGNLGVMESWPALSTWTIQVLANYGGDNTLPVITLAATAVTPTEAMVTLPMWGLEAESSWAMDGSNELPLFVLDASAATGHIAGAELTAPALLLDAAAGSYAFLELPLATVEVAGVAGTVGSAELQSPAIVAETAILSAGFSAASNTRRAPTLEAYGLATNAAVFDEVLKPVRIVASGVIGYRGRAELTLPGLVLGAEAYSNTTGQLDSDTPTWEIDAAAFNDIAEAYRAWALNVRTAALSEYSGLAFNSFGTFNGRVLAAGPTGVHVVGEADKDDTVNISALVRTAMVDFGTTYNKRVPRAYLGASMGQDMEFHTITTHDGTRAYLIQRNGNPDMQQRRVPIGRGPKSRFWQFEVANRDGGDFTVADILVYPEADRRRVV
jgi:DNA-binding beta-propeller fold protein YncE